MRMTIRVCDAPVYIPVDKMKIHPDNPREIGRDELDDLKESIRTKGIYRPFLVWNKGGLILSGNKRYEAVRELLDEGFTIEGTGGLPSVIHKNPDPDLAKKILIESNTHKGKWIDDLLKKILKDAEGAGHDPREYGLNQDEIDKLLSEAVKGADEALGDGEYDKDPGKAKTIKEEEYESLFLPKPIYEQLMGILSEIAVKLNEDWKSGDSVVEATQALCQAMRESGFMEKL